MEHGYNTDPEDSDWDVHFTVITKTFSSPNLANRDTVVTPDEPLEEESTYNIVRTECSVLGYIFHISATSITMSKEEEARADLSQREWIKHSLDCSGPWRYLFSIELL